MLLLSQFSLCFSCAKMCKCMAKLLWFLCLDSKCGDEPLSVEDMGEGDKNETSWTSASMRLRYTLESFIWKLKTLNTTFTRDIWCDWEIFMCTTHVLEAHTHTIRTTYKNQCKCTVSDVAVTVASTTEHCHSDSPFTWYSFPPPKSANNKDSVIFTHYSSLCWHMCQFTFAIPGIPMYSLNAVSSFMVCTAHSHLHIRTFPQKCRLIII